VPRTWSMPAWWGLCFAIFVALALASGAAAQDVLGEPAMGSSQNPAEMTVGTKNPEDLTVGTENPASLQGYSQPLPAPVNTQNPSALTAETVNPTSLEAAPYSLESLPGAAVQERQVRENVAREVADDSPAPSFPVSRAQAELQLNRARTRLEAANSAVGKMIRRDYPTGEARLRIYDEQQAAKNAMSAARESMRRFDGSSNGTAATNP